MRIAVTTTLVPETRGGPYVFSNGLEVAFSRAAVHEFDGVEILPPAPQAVDPAAVDRLMRRYRQRVAALDTAGGWLLRRLSLSSADAAVRTQAREFIRSMIDLGGKLGAPVIVGSIQGRAEGEVTREKGLAWLGEALAELAQHARQYHVPVLYEPLNRYETNLQNRVMDTAAWLRTLPSGNLRLVANLFHMNIEEADSPAAIHEAGKLLGYVHFSDSNRWALGFGQMPLKPIVEALRRIGYDGYLSADVFPIPDGETAAARTVMTFKAEVQAAGARDGRLPEVSA